LASPFNLGAVPHIIMFMPTFAWATDRRHRVICPFQFGCALFGVLSISYHPNMELQAVVNLS